MSKHTIKIGIRDNRLCRIIGRQIVELLEPLIAAVTERFTPFDVLIARDGIIMDELPEGSAISAHTPVRRAQLLHYREDLSIVDFSGNLEERMKKLEMGEVDGL